MRVGFFALPRGFGQDVAVDVIQRNAISTWVSLSSHVTLYGDEPGIAEVAKEFGCSHFAEVDKNGFGTPLLHQPFDRERQKDTVDVTVYVNSDILLTPSLLLAAEWMFNNYNNEPWLLVGRRHDINNNRELNLQLPLDQQAITNLLTVAKLHGSSALDYFCYSTKIGWNMPPFPVGRPSWDNWLLNQARRRRIKIVDGTSAIIVFHQNHLSGYRSYSNESLASRVLSKSLFGFHVDTLDNVPIELHLREGVFYLRKRYSAYIFNNAMVRALIALKRFLANITGILFSR